MKKMIAGALILLVGLAIGWFWKSPPVGFVPSQLATKESKPAVAFGAQITLIDGSVEYREGKGEWKRAVVNTVLKEGSSVEVLGEGRAVITLDDGSAIRLNNASSVTLNTLQDRGITITNIRGQVYTRVVKSDRPFFVRARNVVYESMGTAYKTINENERQGVEVYESSVKVLGATSNEILVSTGKKFDVINVKDKKTEKKLAVLDKKEITKDKFIQWNKEQDSSNSDFKDKLGILDDSYEGEVKIESVPVKTEIKPAEVKLVEKKTEEKKIYSEPAEVKKPAETGSVTSLSIQSAGAGKVSWAVSGDSKSGFKVVWSKESGPVYPTRSNDKFNYLTEPGARSAELDAFDGPGFYYVRVCEYLGGKCGLYSNQIQVNLGEALSAVVRSITLSAGPSSVSWNIDGYSKNGFKISWSKNPNPTYPTRDGDKFNYLAEPTARTSALEAFNGPGIYYVRVCEYLGGKCGVYSNEVQVNLQ